MELAKHIDLNYAGAAVSAGSSIDDNSSRFDMANYEGILFFTTITDSVQNGVATLKVEQNTSDADSGMAAISGATATATSAVNDDLNGKVLSVNVHKPRERYVQGVRTSSAANIAYGEIYAVRYGPRVLPTSDGSTIADSAQVVSPAEA